MVENNRVGRSMTIDAHLALKRPRKKRPKVVLSDWYVVRVKTNQERRAKRYLERAGHRVFMPWLCDEDSVIEKPLFPGYIFVLGPAWYHIKSTPGCLAPLMMGESPGCVPLREMDALRGIVDKEGVIVLKRERFVKGQAVRARKGPFQELWGVYIGETAGKRVQALYRVFGREYQLEFSRSDVTAFGPDVDAQQEALAAARLADPVRSPLRQRRPGKIRN